MDEEWNQSEDGTFRNDAARTKGALGSQSHTTLARMDAVLNTCDTVFHQVICHNVAGRPSSAIHHSQSGDG